MDILSTFLFADWLTKPVWMWLMFIGIVAVLLVLDLGVLHKEHREISARRHHSVTALQQAAGHARNGRSHATGPPDDVRPADLARTRHATDTRR